MTDILKTNEEKARIRAVYRKKRAELTDARKREEDAYLCRRILLTAAYRNAESVLLYCPMKNEINVMPIMAKAIADGKKVAFPKCKTDGEMNFHYVNSEKELTSGAYGIFEPNENSPVFDVNDINAMCIVPGLVFDSSGYRIGYGGGYYDRFLAKFRGVSIAPVRRGFLFDEPLPRDGFDQKTDIILISEGGDR